MTTFSKVFYLCYIVFFPLAVINTLKYVKNNLMHLKDKFKSQFIQATFLAFVVSWIFYPLIILEWIYKKLTEKRITK